MKIDEAIKTIKESGKKNFVQSIDFVVNLKNIDLRKSENKINKEIILPHKIGKNTSICIISDSFQKSDKFDVTGKSELLELGNDKKAAKKFAKKYDFFICEAPLMLTVGKVLGRYLGPLGKMPSPIPPNMKSLDGIVESKTRAIKIRVRDSPVIHTMIAKENMDDGQIKENAMHALGEIEKALPNGRAQIRSVFIKTTMGKAVKVGM